MTLKDNIIQKRRLLSQPVYKDMGFNKVDFGYGITGEYKKYKSCYKVVLSNGYLAKVQVLNAIPMHIRLFKAVRNFGNGFKLRVVEARDENTCIAEYSKDNISIARGIMQYSSFVNCLPIQQTVGGTVQFGQIDLEICDIYFKGKDLCYNVVCHETRLSTVVNLNGLHQTYVQDVTTGLNKKNIYELFGNNREYDWTMDGYAVHKVTGLYCEVSNKVLNTRCKCVKKLWYGSKNIWVSRLDNNKNLYASFLNNAVYTPKVNEKMNIGDKTFEIISIDRTDRIVYIKTGSGNLLAVHDYHVPDILYERIGVIDT